MRPATRKSNEARAPMTERRFDPRRWLMLLIEPLDPRAAADPQPVAPYASC